MTDQERRHVTDLLAAQDALIHWCETLSTAHADLVELASDADLPQTAILDLERFFQRSDTSPEREATREALVCRLCRSDLSVAPKVPEAQATYAGQELGYT